MRLLKRVMIFIFLQYFVFFISSSAIDHKTSLIIVQLNPDFDGVARKNSLVRLHFVNGKFTKQENLLTTSELRFDIGANQIVDGRYIVSHWGDVFDLKTQNLIHKGEGELVGVDEQLKMVITRVERNTKQDIYTYNLETGKYEPMKEPGNWAHLGQRSPSGQLDATGFFMSITLYKPDGTSLLLGSNFDGGGTPYCNSFMSPRFHWVDDEHILTQRKNGELVLVDIKGKVVPIVTIPNVESYGCGPEFIQDAGGQVHYKANNGDWLIDISKHHYENYVWQNWGIGFDIEVGADWTEGHAVRKNGLVIGKWPADIYDAATQPGTIAVVYGKPGSPHGVVSEGIKVWSEETKEWTSIGPMWVSSIVGWVED